MKFVVVSWSGLEFCGFNTLLADSSYLQFEIFFLGYSSHVASLSQRTEKWPAVPVCEDPAVFFPLITSVKVMFSHVLFSLFQPSDSRCLELFIERLPPYLLTTNTHLRSKAKPVFVMEIIKSRFHSPSVQYMIGRGACNPKDISRKVASQTYFSTSLWRFIEPSLQYSDISWLNSYEFKLLLNFRSQGWRLSKTHSPLTSSHKSDYNTSFEMYEYIFTLT